MNPCGVYLSPKFRAPNATKGLIFIFGQSHPRPESVGRCGVGAPRNVFKTQYDLSPHGLPVATVRYLTTLFSSYPGQKSEAIKNLGPVGSERH